MLGGRQTATLLATVVAVVLLVGCQQSDTVEPEETTMDDPTTEATTEETAPERTVVVERTVVERTVEEASEPETAQVSGAAPTPTPAVAQAPTPPPDPVPVEAPAPLPIQPYDNEPSVTGVPCAVWTCRDEFGRTNADIQREFLQERQAAIDEAWRTPSPPGAPPLQEAAKAAYAAGDRTAGG